jgi:hypothetical protein
MVFFVQKRLFVQSLLIEKEKNKVGRPKKGGNISTIKKGKSRDVVAKQINTFFSFFLSVCSKEKLINIYLYYMKSMETKFS